MRNRGSKSLGIALAMVSMLTTGAIAGTRHQPAPNPLRGQPFTVSGSFSGALEGEVRLDGVQYRFDADARIYEVGRGFLPAGSSVYGRTISLSGQKVRNVMVVHSVLVRPASSTVAGGLTRIREESAPK